jgi:hypothetical protein
MIRKAKRNYYQNVSQEYTNNPKKLWKSIRELMPKKDNTVISDISADSFNDFFSTIGEKVAGQYLYF